MVQLNDLWNLLEPLLELLDLRSVGKYLKTIRYCPSMVGRGKSPF
jgi:hypothetical protein